jgi:hypothetical protein
MTEQYPDLPDEIDITRPLPVVSDSELTLILPPVGGVGVLNTMQEGAYAYLASDADWGNQLDDLRSPETGELEISDIMSEVHVRPKPEDLIVGIRDRFGRLSERQRDIMEPYLKDCARLVYSGKRSLRPEMDGKRWVDWIPTASLPEVLAFIDAHATILEGQAQSPEVAETFAEELNGYITTAESWIPMGRFTPETAENLKRLHKVKLVIGDLWDTHLQQVQAYHNLGTGVMVIGQGIVQADESPVEQIVAMERLTVKHESDHGVNGAHMPASIYEAMATHIPAAMDHGEFEIFDPDLRTHQDHRYSGFRKLVHSLSYDGDEMIEPERWTLAHSSSGRDSAEYRYLDDKIVQNWGFTLAYIDGKVFEYQKRLLDKYQDDPRPFAVVQSLACRLVMRDLKRLREEQRTEQDTEPALEAHVSPVTAIIEGLRRLREKDRQ